MTYASARRRYVTDAVQTVSPQRLVVMLYERLLRDITTAGEALGEGNLEEVHRQLVHAQEIVVELAGSLDVEAWSGGEALMDLYAFLSTELVQANVHKDAERIESCRLLVAPLADAWRRAAETLQPDGAATPQDAPVSAAR